MPKTHGLTRANGKRTPIYIAWINMKARCKINVPHYEFYGSRGIAVCERWRTSFITFVADVGEHPGPGYSLDRIDNKRGYEPGNVRWTTHTEQMRNCRTSKLTLEDARMIRRLYAARNKTTRNNGMTAYLMAEFGVSDVTIHRIVSNKIWRE